MTKLTQEQLQTIEDAFNSLPEDMRTGRYRNMEGIGEQLASGAETIFYMTRGEDIIDDGKININYEIKSMKVKVKLKMDVITSLEVLQVLDGATAGYSKEYAPERIVRLREVMEQLNYEKLSARYDDI
jgi:hypothetical protein